jgi:hypothetical protein
MIKTLLLHLLPLHGGAYRAQGARLQRTFGPWWLTTWVADSEAQAERIASELNEVANRRAG